MFLKNLHSKRAVPCTPAISGTHVPIATAINLQQAKAEGTKNAGSPPTADYTIRIVRRTLNDSLKVYRVQFKHVVNDISIIITTARVPIVYWLKQAVSKVHRVKEQIRVAEKFFKPVDPQKTIVFHFNSKQKNYVETSNFEEQYRELMSHIEKQIDEFTRRGSGWVRENMLFMDKDMNIRFQIPTHSRQHILRGTEGFTAHKIHNEH